METMQMVATQIRIELKAERIQEPSLAVGDTAASFGFVLDLAVPQQYPVTIELAEPKVTITLYGNSAEAAPAALSNAG